MRNLSVSIFFVSLSLGGCGSNYFHVYTNHPETGDPWVYYQTYEFCAIDLIDSRGIGIFIAENGGLFDQGDLNIWIYNTNDKPLDIEVLGVEYFILGGLGQGNYEIPGMGRTKIVSEKFKFTQNGNFFTVRIRMQMDKTFVLPVIELRRFNFESAERVSAGCGEPTSIEEFFKELEYQKRMDGLLSKSI